MRQFLSLVKCVSILRCDASQSRPAASRHVTHFVPLFSAGQFFYSNNRISRGREEGIWRRPIIRKWPKWCLFSNLSQSNEGTKPSDRHRIFINDRSSEEAASAAASKRGGRNHFPTPKRHSHFSERLIVTWARKSFLFNRNFSIESPNFIL